MEILNHLEDENSLQSLRVNNEFNKFTRKHFYVNPNKEVVIKGIMSRLILTETEQVELLKDIQNIIARKTLDDEITLLERLALKLILEGTY